MIGPMARPFPPTGAALLVLCLGILLAQVATSGQSLAPYVPTPPDVVDRMLVMAGTTRDDIVYDLGSGDGRIPIAAAKTYGARGVGIDIDPRRVEESRANAKAEGVEHLVEFRLGDALAADVSPATVVTLYMLGSGNAALRPVLTRQLRPGARVVSHAFSMGPSWPAEKIDHFTSARGDEVTLYLWKADGRIRP
jgi:SAM-dependent methyltransferase